MQPGDFHEVFPKNEHGFVPFGKENLIETYKVGKIHPGRLKKKKTCDACVELDNGAVERLL